MRFQVAKIPLWFDDYFLRLTYNLILKIHYKKNVILFKEIKLN